MTKKRSTSIDKAMENIENASTMLEPPKLAGSLDAKELKIFHMLSEAKAADDWFPHEAYLLVRLARLSARLTTLQNQLYKRGREYEKVSNNGNEGRSALATEVESMIRQQLAMMRTLNLSSAIRDKRHLGKRAKRQKDTKAVVAKSGKVTLLAVPSSGG